jgi:MFS family permease
MLKFSDLNIVEKKTFLLHTAYSILDGTIYGILAMNEFVLLKSLKGTDYQVGILFQLATVVLIFSILFNELIKRTRHKKKFLIFFTIITRSPLMLLIFFPDSIKKITLFHQYAFLLILLCYYLSTTILLPMINLFLKQAYRQKNFGRLYSYSTSISKIAALISTFVAGILLDSDKMFFKKLYFFMSIISIVAIFILTRIDYEDKIAIIKISVLKSLNASLQRMKKILKNNKAFLHFEIAFMLYGLAFLTTQGVISLFLNNKLHLNYSSLAFYKNAFNTVNILLLPVFGKIIGNTDPRKFAIYTFSSLAMFFFFLFVSSFWDSHIEFLNIKIYYSLIVAYFFFGIFSASMGLLWYIGSSYFAKTHQAADYQSIHLSFTGLRGMFGPVLGIYFFTILGYNGVFILGIFFLFLAILTMLWSKKHFTISIEK